MTYENMEELVNKLDDLREAITRTVPDSRPRSIALTRLDECTLWLTSVFSAMLVEGEAPEHVMSDEWRTTDARSVPHHL